MYTLEHHFKIVDSNSGEPIVIGDDGEGSVCEITQCNNSIFVPKDAMPMFVRALNKWIDSQEPDHEY